MTGNFIPLGGQDASSDSVAIDTNNDDSSDPAVIDTNNDDSSDSVKIDTNINEDSVVATERRCECEMTYEKWSWSKSYLYAMCYGLKAAPKEGDNDTPPRTLGDFNIEPFVSSESKKMFIPVRYDLWCEAKRRISVSSIPLSEQFSIGDRAFPF